jgi:hypothetical protein
VHLSQITVLFRGHYGNASMKCCLLTIDFLERTTDAVFSIAVYSSQTTFYSANADRNSVRKCVLRCVRSASKRTDHKHVTSDIPFTLDDESASRSRRSWMTSENCVGSVTACLSCPKGHWITYLLLCVASHHISL